MDAHTQQMAVFQYCNSSYKVFILVVRVNLKLVHACTTLPSSRTLSQPVKRFYDLVTLLYSDAEGTAAKPWCMCIATWITAFYLTG